MPEADIKIGGALVRYEVSTIGQQITFVSSTEKEHEDLTRGDILAINRYPNSPLTKHQLLKRAANRLGYEWQGEPVW